MLVCTSQSELIVRGELERDLTSVYDFCLGSSFGDITFFVTAVDMVLDTVLLVVLLATFVDITLLVSKCAGRAGSWD